MHIKCDILIAGAGLAGLSLLYRAMKMGVWTDKHIIVIDPAEKVQNDRTWSFWKKGDFFFDELIKNKWNNLYFFCNDGTRLSLDSGDYTYNSIKSIDFYTHIHSYLKQFPNLSFIKEEVLTMETTATECVLRTASKSYKAQYIFNSIYKKPEHNKKEQYFLQHFKGLRIKTTSSIPALSDAWLMDFRTDQDNGTTFFYTLPMSTDELFIEYTLFSKEVLKEEQYDQQIHKYIRDILKIETYEILEHEYGIIPMTDHRFKRFEGNIINLGTAGGDTRGSTGYTFTNTQKTINKILLSIESHGHPFFKSENIGLKEQLYDSTLLTVLAKRKYHGYQLFSDLFRHTPAHIIFAFLDAESTIFQDLFIMKSLRTMPFLRSFITAVSNRLNRN